MTNKLIFMYLAAIDSYWFQGHQKRMHFGVLGLTVK